MACLTAIRRAVRALSLVAGLALVLGPVGRVGAVIKIDLPVSGKSGMVQKSGAVIVGSVTAINADARVAEVKIDKAIKGTVPSEQIRVQFVAPADLFAQVQPGQCVVLMIQASNPTAGLMHAADTWLLAQRAGATNIWRVVKRMGPEYAQAFPGRTAALAELLTQVAADKYPLLDKMAPNYFGNVRKIDKLPVAKPDGLLAVDVNGDKALDYVVTAGGKVHLFIAGESGLADAAAGAGLGEAAATGATLAAGDVNGDGKTDLLLGKTLYLGGAKFTDAQASLAPPADCLRAALIDADGDGKLDAVYVSASGALLVYRGDGTGKFAGKLATTLWQGQAASAAWIGPFGEEDKPAVLAVVGGQLGRYPLAIPAAGAALPAAVPAPADFERLTGVNLSKTHLRYAEGLIDPAGCVMDVNGDKRADLFLVAKAGCLLLVNRGFGGFLFDFDAGKPFGVGEGAVAVPFKLAGGTLLAGGDVNGDGADDVLVLADDGTLYEVRNVKPDVKE